MLKTPKKLHIWLVGGTQGIGLALAKRWLIQGHLVVVSGRSIDQTSLRQLATEFPHTLHRVAMDLTLPETFQSAFDQALNALEGRMDLWFYNAGAYQPMTLETWSSEACVQMNQVNYLAVTQLIPTLFAHFKTQGHGQWVWNGSLASVFGLPYSGGYGPSKAALASLAESLQPELARYGITLRLINHGFVKSRLTDLNPFEMPQLMETQEAADTIIHALEHTRGFEIHFPWRLAKSLRLLRLLPIQWALALTKKVLK